MAEDILKDSRFTKYLNDPRYRQIPRHERKVKIDKRFQSMFKDDKFKVKYTVDKRGRPINETSSENLRRYYELGSGEESTSEEEHEDNCGEKIPTTQTKNKPKDKQETSGQFVRRTPSKIRDSDGEAIEDEKFEDLGKSINDTLVQGKIKREIRNKLYDLDIDYARGEGLLQSDSSSDEESSTVSEESGDEHGWGELDADADSTDEATNRLAVCNMDWDNMKASDIMVLFNSFVPPGGVIHKVTIFPSEYGMQRMKEEEVHGPIELVDSTKKEAISHENDNDNEEGSSFDMEQLRRYQLNRLRYYYAVVECDSPATADRLYAECDGMEYESSATKLDLRFIPDDTTFDQEPKEVCTVLPDLGKYRPRLFTTTALQQAKVELTWDATNPNRTDVIRQALDGKVDDLEINEYLADSSDEDEQPERQARSCESETEADPISKYKNLLADIEKKEERKNEKDMEMEITWGLGVKEKAEQLVKKAQADDKDMTPFEKQMQKRREKKKQKKLERKQKLEQRVASGSDQQSSEEEDIPPDVDMNDPYFAEEFNKSKFKKDKKKKKDPPEDEEEQRRKAELELLLDEDDGKAHFSLKKIQDAEKESKKSKRKKKLKDKMKESKSSLPDFDINVNDGRFSAIFNSHHFNIDPTDPNYKKTKNMEKLIQEKLKRRPAEITQEVQPSKKSKEEAELSLLVKSIKRKTQDAIKFKK